MCCKQETIFVRDERSCILISSSPKAAVKLFRVTITENLELATVSCETGELEMTELHVV